MTGYVRLHSLHWKTFSVEWSGRLHLGQAKLIGLINVVSDNEISPLLKMTGVPPNGLRYLRVGGRGQCSLNRKMLRR